MIQGIGRASSGVDTNLTAEIELPGTFSAGAWPEIVLPAFAQRSDACLVPEIPCLPGRRRISAPERADLAENTALSARN